MASVDRKLAVAVAVLSLFVAPLTRVARAHAQVPPVLLADPDAGDVRALPLCTTNVRLPGAGETFTCRPQWRGTRSGPTLEIDELELGPGGIEAPRALAHSAFTIGASATVWLVRELGVRVHYDYVSAGARELDVDGDGKSDSRPHHSLNASLVSAGLSLRLFTDEVNREAWLAELEGGVLIEHDGIFPSGPFVQVALGRQVGKMLGLGHSALHLSLLLVGTQGLAELESYRSLSLVLRYGIELAPREPRDMDRAWHAPDLDYVLGGRLDLVGGQLGKGGGTGITSGLALIFGLPFEKYFEPRVEVGFTWFGTLADHEVPLSYTTMGGIRLRLADILPVFLQVLGGWGFSFGTQSPQGHRVYDDGPVLDLSFGAYFADCGVGGSFGVRYLAGLSHENAQLQGVILFGEVDYGSRAGALGDRRRHHENGESCSSGSTPSVPQVRTGN